MECEAKAIAQRCESDKTFRGNYYRLCNNWFEDVPVKDFCNRPINYLEIGGYYGANLLSVCNHYAKHPQSKAYVIDPWIDYEEYTEYKGKQTQIFYDFLHNITISGHKDKINIYKGYSHNEIPRLPDEYFDIIYIDGNHSPPYILEDCVLAYRKLKVGGYMILDDYGWIDEETEENTEDGIDAFMVGYASKMIKVGLKNTQMILRKKK